METQMNDKEKEQHILEHLEKARDPTSEAAKVFTSIISEHMRTPSVFPPRQIRELDMIEKTITIEVSERFAMAISQKLNQLKAEERNQQEVSINMEKLFSFWNSKLEFIVSQITDESSRYKWMQLVWQELYMWTLLNNTVYSDEFEDRCGHKGFDDIQKNILIEGLGAIRMRNFDFKNEQDQMDTIAYHM